MEKKKPRPNPSCRRGIGRTRRLRAPATYHGGGRRRRRGKRRRRRGCGQGDGSGGPLARAKPREARLDEGKAMAASAVVEGDGCASGRRCGSCRWRLGECGGGGAAERGERGGPGQRIYRRRGVAEGQGRYGVRGGHGGGGAVVAAANSGRSSRTSGRATWAGWAVAWRAGPARSEEFF